MAKRVLALALCLIMLASALVGCAKKDENDKGAYVYMYLTDMVYDMDPAHAYENESNLRIVSLLFDNLFVLDEKGKVKKSLAKSYKISENDQLGEYKMTIELNDTCWTDGMAVSANDVVFAWKRILTVEDSYEAAALLYDLKNARAVKEGDATIDELGVYALNEKTVEIVFEKKIDYDQFLVNLTSYALVPLREEIVTKTDDWAKKASTMVCSGPFRLRSISYEKDDAGITLERNPYYYRDIAKDKIDKSVTPYRIIVDYTMTDEQIMQAYNEGKIFYVGDIPLSVRGSYKDVAEITDALSTHTYIPNHNAIIRYYDAAKFEALSTNECMFVDDKNNWAANYVDGTALVEGTDGDKIFANADVRRALSLAIDRNAIAQAAVFAQAATGLVPYGVFDADSAKKSFREVGGELIKSSADMAAAKEALNKAGVDASKYMFAITVASYDEVHMMVAEMVQKAWQELGFHVAINAIDVIVNDDILKTTNEVSKDIKDDIFAEAYRAGAFEMIAVDYTAYSADAYSALARLAKAFSGQGMDMSTSEYNLTPHISGYDSESYNKKIEDAFAEKNIANRATLLHEAEKMLIDEMAVIPVMFNQSATLTSKDLSKVKTTYYCTTIFTKTKLKDYELYVPVEE